MRSVAAVGVDFDVCLYQSNYWRSETSFAFPTNLICAVKMMKRNLIITKRIYFNRMYPNILNEAVSSWSFKLTSRKLLKVNLSKSKVSNKFTYVVDDIISCRNFMFCVMLSMTDYLKSMERRPKHVNEDGKASSSHCFPNQWIRFSSAIKINWCRARRCEVELLSEARSALVLLICCEFPGTDPLRSKNDISMNWTRINDSESWI